MQQSNEVIHYDAVIIGAGPAGCACALALKDSGLKVAIIDKQAFPRDKVCGDAIPGRAIKTLGIIDPEFEKAFKSFPKKEETKKTVLFYKGNQLTFNWVRPAYTCTRMEFDNFLLTLVKENTATDIYLNTEPGKLIISENNITIPLKGSDTIISAKILIGADGTHSAVGRQLTNKTLDRKHHVGSVRAYYRNVAGCNADTTEIYFDKQFLPSYLWVFPLPDNRVNAGFGMLSSEIAKRKVNLRNTFYAFIDRVPELNQKFKHATRVGDLEGFGLPLGSNITTLSGSRFMLAGDAASLIDPISGDGIGNAMLSGRLAAEQVVSCCKQQEYTAAFMQQYDVALLHAIGKELKTRYWVQRLLSAMPFLLDIVFLAGRNKFLKKLIQKGL